MKIIPVFASIIFVLCGFSAVSAKVQGVYVGSDTLSIYFLQVLATSNDQLVGRFEADSISRDFSIHRFSASVNGIYSDGMIALQLRSDSTLGNIPLTGNQRSADQVLELSGVINGNRIQLVLLPSTQEYFNKTGLSP